MGAAVSKQNARQSHKHKGYYAAQFDKTKVNKIITTARHIAIYEDKRAFDRLKQKPEIDKSRAANLAPSERIKDVIQRAYKH